ncbi:MAG: hypothetical protein MUF87_22110 [Anaerolineae bacterium]|jgi:hypothetical protein|nr:hypothetical protein [Anaerolineae bacterium]
MSSRAILFGVMWVALLLGGSLGITSTEAHFLAVIRDVTPLEPAAPSEVLRAVRINVTALIQRSDHPVYPLLLDGWATLFGDSIQLSRLLSAWMSLIAFALIMRLPLKSSVWLVVPIMVFAGHTIAPYALLLLLGAISQLTLSRSRLLYAAILIIALYTDLGALLLIPLHALILRDARHLGWLMIGICVIPYVILKPPMVAPLSAAIVTLPALITLLASRVDRARLAITGAALISLIYVMTLFTRPDWPGQWAQYLTERDPRHPVIVAWTPESIPAAYDHALQLRRGISVDLGWRDFDPTELSAILNRLTVGDQPVWVILAIDDPQTDRVLPLLERTYQLTLEWAIAEFRIYRFNPK